MSLYGALSEDEFAEQTRWCSEATMLRSMRKRDVAPSTLSDWEGCLNAWLVPTTINGTPSATSRLQLSSERSHRNSLTGWSRAICRLRPSRITSKWCGWSFLLCVDEDGMETYPRNWRKMGLVIPKVNRRKQRRPCFTKDVMNHLANSPTVERTMRMLFILCGATGLRLGEALGIRVEKILDGGSRIIIDQKAWRGEIQ